MAGNNSGGKRAATRTATAGSGGRAPSARFTPDSAGRNVQFQSPPPQTPPTMRTVRINDVDLYVMFLPHTIYGQRWADGWNSSYGITLRTGDIEGLFTDASTDTDLPILVSNPEQALLRAIRTAILSQAAPRDDPQYDTAFIQLFDMNAHLKIDVNAPILMRPNSSTLARALRRCATADEGLVLHLALNHIYADFSVVPFNFRDLTLFASTPYDNNPPCPLTFDNCDPAPPPVAPDFDRLTDAIGNIDVRVQPLPDTFGRDIGAAIANNLPNPVPPQPPLPQNFSTELRDAITAGLTGAIGNAPPARAPPPPAPVPDTFDPTGLPSGEANVPPTMEPRDRYFANQEQRVFTQDILHTVYNNGQRYHLDGLRRIVLADGTVFVRKDLDEKGIFRAMVQCRDTSPLGIRTWYHNLGDHLRAHGCFILPFWLFRADSGDTGFSIGDAPAGAHDLPLMMRLPCLQSSNLIFRYLSSDKIFPADSQLRDIVDASRGDGYRALKQIIYAVHPAFHRAPGILVSAPPIQGDDSILQYVLRFNDYLQLRAFVQNIASSIEDPDQRDLLFNGAKYSDYIAKMARLDLRDPTLAHKFTATHLVETLNAYLKEPDSPLFKDWQKEQYKKIQTMHSQRPSPDFRPIHPVDTASPSDSSESSSASALNTFYDEAMQLEASTDDERQLQHLYAVSLFAVKTNPARNCLICGEQHTFDNCPVLNNAAFLRNHFIRFCQFLKRDQNYSRNGEVWKGGQRSTSRPSSRNSQGSRSSPTGRSSPRARQPLQSTPIRVVDTMDATQEPSDQDLGDLLSDHEPEDVPGTSYQDFLSGRWN